MSTQMTKKTSDQLLDIAKPWDGDEAIEPTFFSLRAQMLDAGNTEEPLAVGDHLWVKIKVYAKGGENKLHAHPHQDHSFIVLDGEAQFHGPRGEEKTLKRNDGILLPAGSYYWFETTSEEPLVILRLGACSHDGHPDTRIMDDGVPKVRRGRHETFISEDVKYRDGAFYK
jgi:mannose-6-phosphate isomerase-like protein (cupin superfamily)